MTHASLFSGIGGPEVAAAMLGWDNLFHCEINPFGRRVLEYHFPDSVSYEDIKKTDFSEWRGRVDVLTGGFPCQPFSYAGKRGGAEDDRYLWPEMLRAISECQPTWVVGENVSGITTMVEQESVVEVGAEATLFEDEETIPGRVYEELGRYTIDRVCSDLEAIGYAVQPVLIPACAVGAPHRRDRVFIIAYRTDAGLESVRREWQDTVYGLGTTADTDRERREEPEQSGRRAHSQEERAGMDDRTERYGCNGFATDTYNEMLERRLFQDTKGHRQSADGSVRHFRGGSCKAGSRNGNATDTSSPGERWNDFPSVSPVHRGNDGLPFDVDDLTIPFTQWRTESLKAYGNAIVPQVMYEIFRAIEIITKNNNEYESV